MQATPYDEMLEIKHGTTRKEHNSTLMAMLHSIPKKVADVAQTQGVTEKFLEAGMASGVITPSMLAHDRFLSAMDAVKDALMIGMFIILLPILSINWFTITIVTFIMIYWFFHIGWWEKAKIWGIKSAAIRYLKNTYFVYWLVFFIMIFPIVAGAWYFIFKLSIQVGVFSVVDWFLVFLSGMEKAIASVFGHIAFIQNNFSSTANYAVSLDSMQYEYRFVIISSIFLLVTIIAKIIFSKIYAKHKAETIESSADELKYTGQSAIETINKARNE